ncbi:MAG: bifunctional adenosylcobinamide kinase/adenosylcobinamide-phosphate guanylyltransferase [Propionibacteriaceae bacterium]|jgi:adenosyl cobinamide kinase/adenosyl cobinamide phosphate guanylyltransferase|nr:bifunctional adenosylcobinamide kinase/adenosylcobinamide-phosphate guanylyltransferase [Propionibacteriaceae bacterium]
MMTLVIGPNGSGKSAAAEQLIHDLHAADPTTGALIYLATMIPVDDNGHDRVVAHRHERSGAGFITLESPTADIERTHPGFIEACDLVLVEDVSNLLSNLIFAAPAPNRRGADQACQVALARLDHLGQISRHVVAVTIGGLAPAADFDDATNEYITALSRLNQALGDKADQIIRRGSL